MNAIIEAARRVPGRKKWLTHDETDRILLLARENPRDYNLIRLLRYSLRIGEVVGNGKLTGIYPADLRENGVWIRGKGGTERFVTMPSHVMKELQSFKHGKDRVFSMTERNAEYIVKGYARRAAIPDWQYVSPHRLRAYFATDLKDRKTDPFTIKELMRHKDIRTTQVYVGPPTPEQQEQIIESLD